MSELRASLSKINDYAGFLEECWRLHLAPRAPDAPTFISTFAGTGGSSLGYSMAGYRELLAVEWEDNAAASFRLNFPEVDLFHGDICNLSVEEIFERTGLRRGELSLFDGSPPCQGFSTSGKRNFDDQRNMLFREFVRLLRGLMPMTFHMENVSGMVKGKMKLLFAEILRELKACGYRVRAVLMNAKYFGVPQSRERMIFVGAREDLNIEPSHPRAKYQTITLGEAVRGVETVGIPLTGTLAEVGVSARPGEDFGKTRVRLGLKEQNFSTYKLSWDKYTPTITKVMKPSYAGLVHPSANNMLSIEALKRCGSFPDAFHLTGSVEEQWARIGNSVPPLLMKAIAGNTRAEILDKITSTQ